MQGHAGMDLITIGRTKCLPGLLSHTGEFTPHIDTARASAGRNTVEVSEYVLQPVRQDAEFILYRGTSNQEDSFCF